MSNFRLSLSGLPAGVGEEISRCAFGDFYGEGRVRPVWLGSGVIVGGVGGLKFPGILAICGGKRQGRDFLFLATLENVQCFDLLDNKKIWESSGGGSVLHVFNDLLLLGQENAGFLAFDCNDGSEKFWLSVSGPVTAISSFGSEIIVGTSDGWVCGFAINGSVTKPTWKKQMLTQVDTINVFENEEKFLVLADLKSLSLWNYKNLEKIWQLEISRLTAVVPAFSGRAILTAENEVLTLRDVSLRNGDGEILGKISEGGGFGIFPISDSNFSVFCTDGELRDLEITSPQTDNLDEKLCALERKKKRITRSGVLKNPAKTDLSISLTNNPFALKVEGCAIVSIAVSGICSGGWMGKPSNCLSVDLKKPGNFIPAGSVIKVVILSENGSAEHCTLRLPRFCLFSSCTNFPEKEEIFKASLFAPQFVNSVSTWVADNFLKTSNYCFSSEGRFFSIECSKGLLSISANDVSLLQEVSESLGSFFGASEISAKIELPKEDEKKILTFFDNLDQSTNLKQKLVSEMSEKKEEIKLLTARVEDYYLLEKYDKLSKVVVLLKRAHEDLTDLRAKITRNKSVMETTIKNVNLLVSKLSAIRAGSEKEKIIFKTREAIKGKNPFGLLSILSGN